MFAPGGDADGAPPPEVRNARAAVHYSTNLMLWEFSSMIAILVPNLGLVLNVCGGIGGTGLAIVLPCRCALKLEDRPRARAVLRGASRGNPCAASLATVTASLIATNAVE